MMLVLTDLPHFLLMFTGDQRPSFILLKLIT